MTSEENGQSQYLGRTISPYLGQIIILSLTTLFLLFVSIKTHEWGPLLSAPFFWLLFSILIYIGLKYKISWTDKEVCQEASGGPKICIQYSWITNVTSEVSKPGEVLAASRPFRRIAIYAEDPQGARSFIDVSLKHFAIEDVRKLMRVVHDRRPDLALPKNWVSAQ